MRINLTTPFAEKDAVKALGARWDAARKLWYITDGSDPTPFARWIPDVQTATESPTSATVPRTIINRPARVRPANGPVTTGAATAVPHCGCDVLPWDDCEHTASS